MIVNDPVFGFISISNPLIEQLIATPVMQRLTRIEQLGPTHMVYPAARHTRFQHALGALHLATQAMQVLRQKGVIISDDELEATQIAMLLHDVGHAPMSHALEKLFTPQVSHEEISLRLMEHLNAQFDGRLTLAIAIFTDTYTRHFLHELVCSQLDMDRLDYLCRDSMFTGVREGNIGVERIIKMLGEADDHLVVEEKGIYTIENYLMARRLMYWQVYYHKTVMAAKEVLCMAVRRAKELTQRGMAVYGSPELLHFLQHDVTPSFMAAHPEWIEHFLQTDDADLVSAIKQWTKADDKTLRLLAEDYTWRRLFKSEERMEPVSDATLQQAREAMAARLGISMDEACYFVHSRCVNQMLYSDKDDHICIRLKSGEAQDISQCSQLLHSNFNSQESSRHYLFSQRQAGR